MSRTDQKYLTYLMPIDHYNIHDAAMIYKKCDHNLWNTDFDAKNLAFQMSDLGKNVSEWYGIYNLDMGIEAEKMMVKTVDSHIEYIDTTVNNDYLVGVVELEYPKDTPHIVNMRIHMDPDFRLPEIYKNAVEIVETEVLAHIPRIKKIVYSLVVEEATENEEKVVASSGFTKAGILRNQVVRNDASGHPLTFLNLAVYDKLIEIKRSWKLIRTPINTIVTVPATEDDSYEVD